MATRQDLVDEYVTQMLRVYGACTQDMKTKIASMTEDKLRRDLVNIKVYPTLSDVKERIARDFSRLMREMR